jgi:hypothetical protein
VDDPDPAIGQFLDPDDVAGLELEGDRPVGVRLGVVG